MSDGCGMFGGTLPSPTKCHACGTVEAVAVCRYCGTERPAYTALKAITQQEQAEQANERR